MTKVAVILSCLSIVTRAPSLFLLVVLLGTKPSPLHAQNSMPANESFRSTRPPLPDQARALDETTIQYVDFEYRGGPYSEKFTDLVYEYSARRPLPMSDETQLSQLVVKACEVEYKPTQALFDKALDEIGLIQRTASEILVRPNEGSVPIPPCLPRLQLDIVIRLVLPGDTIDEYWKLDQKCDNCVSMRWSEGNPSILTENLLFLGSLNLEFDKSNAKLTEGLEDLLKSNPFKERDTWKTRTDHFIAMQNEKFRSNSELAAGVLSQLFLAVSTDIPPDEAIETIVKQIESLRPGSAASIRVALQEFSKKFLADKSSMMKNVARIVAISDALDSYTPSRFDGTSLAYADTTIVVQSDLQPTPTIDPISGRDTKLNPGDIVMSLVARPARARIPIDLATVARKKALLPEGASSLSKENIQLALLEASRIFNNEWNITPPGEGQSQPSQLTEDTTVFYTTTPLSSCSSPSTANDDDYLYLNFPDAVFRARMAMAKGGSEPGQTFVVVADSGYSSLPESPDNPYQRYISSSFDPTEDSPIPQFDETTAQHGTAVTGVAMGGPNAWPIAVALGLPISTRPVRIYIKDPFGSDRFLPDIRRIRGVLNGTPDVVNLSIGERKSALGNKGLIEQALAEVFEDDSAPLFVVAAGNNGVNDNPNGGSDIVALELYPQIAGDAENSSVIVVGATDGKKLASFSNFSSRRGTVSVLAPGCGVSSWKVDKEAGRYTDQQFDGTSFSAPLVTYVAGIVYSLTPLEYRSSRRVKARILASSDLRQEFLENVEDGRYLNPTKAVSLYHDVVELEVEANGQTHVETLFGEFRNEDSEVERFCEAGFVAGDTLLKIARTPESDDGAKIVYYTWSDSAGLKRQTCSPRQSVGFRVEGEAVPRNLPIRKIIDVVFKWRSK